VNARAQAFAAVRWASIGSIGRALIGFAQLAVLARLIPTAEFGLIALALAVVNTALILADVGLSSAIIHFQEVSEDELSSLFWLNIAVGVVLTILLAGASPAIAQVYGQPRLIGVFLAISPLFALTALGQQQRALAEKALRFNQLAMIEISATACGFLVAIAAALGGLGVYAIVLSLLTIAAVNSIMAWVVLGRTWRPRFHYRLAETRRFLSYGGYLIAGNLANTLTMQGDVVLAGKLFPGSVLGLYSQPRELCMRIMFVINPIVTRIGLPLIARSQGDLQKVKTIYLNTLRMTASINFPIYAFMALFSSDVVLFIFGQKWIDAGPLLRALALWCLVRSIGNPVGSLLNAMGRTKRALMSSVCVLALLYATVLFASRAGMVGVPYGLLALYAALISPFWFFLVRPVCGARFLEYHRQLAVPALTTLAACCGAYLATLTLHSAFLRLLVGGMAGGATYLVASLIINRSWVKAMIELAPLKRRAVTA
jgi:O-antigen/teichoic acid export membrane protein